MSVAAIGVGLCAEQSPGVVAVVGGLASGVGDPADLSAGGVDELHGLPASGVLVADDLVKRIVGEDFGVTEWIGVGQHITQCIMAELVAVAMRVGDLYGVVLCIVGVLGAVACCVSGAGDVATRIVGIVPGDAIRFGYLGHVVAVIVSVPCALPIFDDFTGFGVFAFIVIFNLLPAAIFYGSQPVAVVVVFYAFAVGIAGDNRHASDRVVVFVFPLPVGMGDAKDQAVFVQAVVG